MALNILCNIMSMLIENFVKIDINSKQGRSQGPDFGGASSFKRCRATSPPRKFNILYRVSEIQKNKGSPFWKFGQVFWLTGLLCLSDNPPNNFLPGFQRFEKMVSRMIGGGDRPPLPPLGYAPDSKPRKHDKLLSKSDLIIQQAFESQLASVFLT